ncbi:MAG: hypothetical protein MAG451_01993 [Anaerolineales bacterium]|nr:hypothetical protein [Anaerolineales bacterium]
MENEGGAESSSERRERQQIVCAARGGKGSRPAVNRAIRLAKERDADLTFLFIADTEFLSHALVGPPSVIREQLRDMGEFIMATLQAKAAEAGVMADYAVCEGEVGEQIREYVQENDVDVLVMGQATEEDDASRFDSGTVSNFAAVLEHGEEVEVVTVGQDDVLME